MAFVLSSSNQLDAKRLLSLTEQLRISDNPWNSHVVEHEDFPSFQNITIICT